MMYNSSSSTASSIRAMSALSHARRAQIGHGTSEEVKIAPFGTLAFSSGRWLGTRLHAHARFK